MSKQPTGTWSDFEDCSEEVINLVKLIVSPYGNGLYNLALLVWALKKDKKK